MTIINLESDGLFPQLIVIFRAVAYSVRINTEELLRVCYPGIVPDSSVSNRLRGALSRWTELGLFTEENDEITLNKQFVKPRGMSVDDFTERLPAFCRSLVMQPQNCLPLWTDSTTRTEEGVGRTADLVRSLSWALAQDIYNLPVGSPKKVFEVEGSQMTGGKFIFMNDTRWNGFRPWACYLGFATGEGSSFLIDPTKAIKEALPSVFSSKKELLAIEFLKSLNSILPVLDFGKYRMEVENILDQTTWRKPTENHLSMSLSFALRRLELSKLIRLQGRSDTGSSFRLTGCDFKTWNGFESVVWLGAKK
mgnify:CR=1 FL=1